MSELLLKRLPLLVGLALGWLLFHPPAILAGLGPWRFAVMAALVLLLLLASVAGLLLKNLPEDFPLQPHGEAAPAELKTLVDAFDALGFREAGPCLRAGVLPPALLIPLVNESAGAYATVFRTGTEPPKVSFDIVSILHGDRGGLTSGADPGGTNLPADPGFLRQAFPGASVAEVFARHRETLEWLRGRGLPARAAKAETFVADFKAAMARQRRAFLSSPLRMSFVALLRSATGRTPHIGPVQEQKVAEDQIRDLLTGQRG